LCLCSISLILIALLLFDQSMQKVRWFAIRLFL
jgi:hypothetical protein